MRENNILFEGFGLARLSGDQHHDVPPSPEFYDALQQEQGGHAVWVVLVVPSVWPGLNGQAPWLTVHGPIKCMLCTNTHAPHACGCHGWWWGTFWGHGELFSLFGHILET